MRDFCQFLIAQPDRLALPDRAIRELRFKNGEMTQKALAQRVGISQQTMNAIKNCRHAPTNALAIRIDDVFHVSVDQLFELDYDGKPVRREQSARVAIDRPQATTREPVKVNDQYAPAEKEAECQTTLRRFAERGLTLIHQPTG